jgi:hypothetical protein
MDLTNHKPECTNTSANYVFLTQKCDKFFVICKKFSEKVRSHAFLSKPRVESQQWQCACNVVVIDAVVQCGAAPALRYSVARARRIARVWCHGLAARVSSHTQLTNINLFRTPISMAGALRQLMRGVVQPHFSPTIRPPQPPFMKSISVGTHALVCTLCFFVDINACIAQHTNLFRSNHHAQQRSYVADCVRQ